MPSRNVSPSVRPSRSYILSKGIKISSENFHRRVATPFWFFLAKWHSKIPTETPLTGASNAGGVGRNRDSEPVSGFCLLLTLPQARVVNTVAGGPQPPHGKLSVTHRW